MTLLMDGRAVRRAWLAALALAAAVAGFATSAAPAQAAPSLDPQHMLTLTVARRYKRRQDGPTKEVKEAYSLIRDHENPLVWYFFPNGPRLAEKAGRPELELLKYQLQDDKGELVEGSILQFATTMGVDPKTHQALKEALAEKLSGLMTGRSARSILREIAKLEAERLPTNRVKIEKLRDDSQIKLALNAADPGAKRVEPRHVRLSVMPFKSVKVNLYAPFDSPAGAEPGQFVGGVSRREGIAPQFASQKTPFTLELTKLGTPVYRSILTGNTGLNVVYQVTYDAITPPAGFVVTIDWKKAYEYYSEEVKQSSGFSGNILGLNLDLSQSHEELDEQIKSMSDKFVDIKILDGHAFTAEDRRMFLLPIMQRIASTILDTSPPPQIDPSEKPVEEVSDCGPQEPAEGEAGGGGNAAAQSPEFDEDLTEDSNIPKEDGIAAEIAENIPNTIPKFNASHSVKIRKIKSEQLVKEVINFTARQFVERTTVVSGFVGIGDFDPKVQETCFRLVKAEDWDAAWFMLPDVKERTMRKLGVNDVALTLRLMDRNNKEAGQIPNTKVVSARWAIPEEEDDCQDEDPPGADGWVCKYLRPGNRIGFPLLNVLENYKRQDLVFEVKTMITREVDGETEEIIDTYYVDVFNGQLPLSSSASNLKTVRVSTSRFIPLAKKREEDDDCQDEDDEDEGPALEMISVVMTPNIGERFEREYVLLTRRDEAVAVWPKPREGGRLKYDLKFTFQHAEYGQFTYFRKAVSSSSYMLTNRTYKRLLKNAKKMREDE